MDLRVEQSVVLPFPIIDTWHLVCWPENLELWLADRCITHEFRPGGALVLRWRDRGVFSAEVKQVGGADNWAWSFALPVRPEERVRGDNATTVELRLEPHGEDVCVRVAESGFEKLNVSEQERAAFRDSRVAFWNGAMRKLEWLRDAPPPEGDPLTLALLAGDFEWAKRLIEAGVDVNRVLHDGSTALTVACSCSEGEPPGAAVSRVRWLVQAGARVPAGGPLSVFGLNRGGTIVHETAEAGDVEVLELLLGADGLWTLDVYDDFQRNPLICAAQNGHLEAVKVLLDAGTDINAHDAENIGETALNRAIRGGHEQAVEYLLERGADPTIPGWMGIDAVDRAGELDPPNPRIVELVKAAAEKRQK